MKKPIEYLRAATGKSVSYLLAADDVDIIRVDEALEAIETAIYEQSQKVEREMYLNMQYYMEYCQMVGYVTPQEWIEKHKHF